MSLIACPDCNRQVSDSAPACPGCGRKIATQVVTVQATGKRWKVMQLALALLVLDFFQYFVVFSARQYLIIEFDYLQYNSVIDLVLQTLLGFGMVIVLLEQVLTDANVANEKLIRAHEKLEELAHIDPLTTALNRHAFHGYLKRRGNQDQAISGCVGFFDVDNLKTVNDVYGHAVGDVVIRMVVRAIRDIVRAEDNPVLAMGGEDVAEFLMRKPGVFFFVGSNDAATGRDKPHHHPGFDFDDERVLPLAAELLAKAALEFSRI